MECLTMEEIFIVTWVGAFLGGIALGFLINWIYEKGKDR